MAGTANPSDVATTCSEADRLVNEGALAEAVAMLGSALAIRPEEPRLLRCLGHAHMAAGRPALAAACFEQALRAIRRIGAVVPEAAEAGGALVKDGEDPELRLIEEGDRAIRARRTAFEPAFNTGPALTDHPSVACPTGPTPAPSSPPSPEIANEDKALSSGSRVLAQRPGNYPPYQTTIILKGGGPEHPPGHRSEQLELLVDDDDEAVLEDALSWDLPVEGEALGADAPEQEMGDEADLPDAGETADAEMANEDDDWTQFALSGVELEEAPTREELEQEVRVGGRLSREERARQVAIELGRRFDWDHEGIDLLTEVFTLHWWSAAKVSMERELTAGMTPEELRSALTCRWIWRSRPAFATDLGYRNSWLGKMTGQAWPIYRSLDWPTALTLSRAFGGDVEPTEIERFLDELYDHWYSAPSSNGTVDSFYKHLRQHLGRVRGSLQEWPDWSFEPSNGVTWDDDGAGDPGYSNREYRWLVENNLVPDLFNSTLPLSAVRFGNDDAGEPA